MTPSLSLSPFASSVSYLGVLSRDLPEEVHGVAGVVRAREESVVFLSEEK